MCEMRVFVPPLEEGMLEAVESMVEQLFDTLVLCSEEEFLEVTESFSEGGVEVVELAGEGLVRIVRTSWERV